MTIEHKDLRIEGSQQFVYAGKFFGHRPSQPDILPAAVDGATKRRVLAVALCIVVFKSDAEGFQRDQWLKTARVVSINRNVQIRTGEHLRRSDWHSMIDS